MTVVYMKKRNGTLEEIGRNEVILNNLNPSWVEKISIAYQFEIVQLLVFHVYDVDTKYHNLPVKMLKLKDQDFLGEASCALSEIITKPSRTLTIKLGNKNKPGVPRNLGTLSVHAEETVASKSAMQIAFRCSRLENVDLVFQKCIKIQKSTGDLEKLHQERIGVDLIKPSAHRGREKAIMEAGEVIQFYDSEKRFPAWGFGGRTFDGTISHCFNLNGSSNGFEVEGVEGIMAAYANALHNVSLAGPTLFGQILDADNGKRLESSTGRVATRDIVQFVPMREVQRGHISVVQELLEELPGQFLGYMQSRDIKPLNLHAAQTPAL
ncbi:hypothetical protein Patl1_22786 [Pistacia atlantica]|uniref:Uncharacterized protein n=1 Tax=Pistacia atlantica TaxID=434234 RepID=A0ACC0ZWX8_9ROSI|nr:hypothetical protein Patl1_22786 [Pistacia atlantica]